MDKFDMGNLSARGLILVGLLGVLVAGCTETVVSEDVLYACDSQNDCRGGYTCVRAEQAGGERVCIEQGGELHDPEAYACLTDEWCREVMSDKKGPCREIYCGPHACKVDKQSFDGTLCGKNDNKVCREGECEPR